MYLIDLALASSKYNLLLCSETLVSDRRHISELFVPGFGRPVLLCLDRIPLAHGMIAYVWDAYGAFRKPKFECSCCEMHVFRVCGARQDFHAFSLDRNLINIAILLTCVSRKVLLKHWVKWTALCDATCELPWHSIWSADYPVEILNVHLSLLAERFVPTKVIRVHNKDKPWFNDDCSCG